MLHPRRTAVVALLLVTTALAGCVDPGPSEDDEAEPRFPAPDPPPPPPSYASVGELGPGCLDEAADGTAQGTEEGTEGVQARPAHQFALGDVDGDGDQDLLLACPGPDRLFTNDPGTGLQPAEATGIEQDSASMAAAWGDVDGDGCLDLALATSSDEDGQPQLDRIHRNRCDGTFEPAGEAFGLTAATDARTVSWIDHDRDGDLDLHVGTADGADKLYANDGNGTLTDVAETAGLATDDTTVAAAWLDVDRDGHPDLVRATEAGTLHVHANLGDGTFLELQDATTLQAPVGPGLTTGDLDDDGDLDLAVAGPDGVQILRNEDDGSFTDVTGDALPEAPNEGSMASAGAVAAVAFADLDSDGWHDLLLLSAMGDGEAPAHQLVYLHNQRNGTFTDATSTTGLDQAPAATTAGVADLDGDGAPELLWTTPQGSLERWAPTELGHLGFTLRLKGNQSNTPGIGSLVEVEDRGRLQANWIGASSSGIAQPTGEVHIGAGERPVLDVITIHWSRGINQVLGLAPVEEPVTIEERASTKTSCPLIFAWDGESYRFVSDVLGNSYIGWLYAEDQYMVPDTTERIRIDTMAPKDGYYEVRIMEALEEIDYLDMARLVAVDHGPGTEVIPDERFNLAPPHDGYGLVGLTDPRPVQAAWTGDGTDVTDLVTERDERSPSVPALPPPTFDGYAEDHEFILELGELPQDDGAPIQLAAWGWIYYPMVIPDLVVEGPYIPPKPPAMEALDPDTGEWVPVPGNMGFPAGLPKWWTMDLTDKLPANATKVRIQTNLQIHWDQILVDTSPANLDKETEIETHQVPLTEAILQRTGYPTYIDRGQQNPGAYTYDEITPVHPWDTPEGNYTRYGEVTPLLQEVDDQFVIFPHGDELVLRFPAEALPELEDGKQRTLFLDLDAFFKDMERYNAYPTTVEPLPFHGMSNYPYGPDEAYPDTPEHRAYQETWNTRYIERGRLGAEVGDAGETVVG